MGKITFVFHCEKCNRMIERGAESLECPPALTGTIDYAPYFTMGATEYGEHRDGRKPYYDEMLDTWVQSKSHKEEILRERNLRQVDSGARKKPEKKTMYFGTRSVK